MHDRIILSDMRFYGRHGVLPREQTHKQPFVVDLFLYVDVTQAATSDNLRDTIDYGMVYHLVRGLVEGESCRLLETLAERLAQAVLAGVGAQGVKVMVKKPQVPLAGQLAYAAVEVERWRQE